MLYEVDGLIVSGFRLNGSSLLREIDLVLLKTKQKIFIYCMYAVARTLYC